MYNMYIYIYIYIYILHRSYLKLQTAVGFKQH